jgi:DNA-directed RNA polymerase specialized sigma24 family protein
LRFFRLSRSASAWRSRRAAAPAPAAGSAVQAAYVEGHSYDELARAFDVPLNTMRTWLRRALIALRKCLES